MAGWTLVQETANFDMYDVIIHRQLDGLNYVECNLIQKPSIGAVVIVKFDSTILFNGTISEIRRISNGEYATKIVEFANELKMMYVHTGVAGTNESRIVTVENAGTKTMRDYVAVIINDTGWTDGTADTRTTNPVTGAAFDNVAFNNAMCYDALQQFVCTTCGYNLWFDKSSKTVYYGAKGALGNGRTNRGAIDNYIINVNDTYSAISYGVDRIIVVSNVVASDGPTYEGAYPTTNLPSRPKTLIYQYNQVASNEEATTIATQIYNERNQPKERFEIEIDPRQMVFYEGDIIQYAETTYSVIDVSVSDESVVLGIKASANSIFDRLGSQIQLVEGSAFNGAEAMWDGGWQNVPVRSPLYGGSSYVDEGDYGKWNFTVSDPAFVSNMHLTINTDCYLQSADITANGSGISNDSTSANGGINPNSTNAHASAPSGSVVVYNMSVPTTAYGSNYKNTTTTIYDSGYTDLIEISLNQQLGVDLDVGLITLTVTTGGGMSGGKLIYFWVQKYNNTTGQWSAANTAGAHLYVGYNMYAESYACSIFLPPDVNVESVSKYKVTAIIDTSSPSGQSINIDNIHATAQLIGSHNHLSEMNNLSVPIVEDDHDHFYVPLSHTHIVADSEHTHTVVNTADLTNQYPESLDIYLINSKYPPGSNTVGGKKLNASALSVGGKRTSFTIDVSKEDIAAEQNTFRIYSTQIGRCQITSTYISYGVKI